MMKIIYFSLLPKNKKGSGGVPDLRKLKNVTTLARVQ